MSDRVSIYNIARTAGVSVSTVSKVINGQGKISVETAGRVQSVIKRLNYSPQQRRSSCNTLGVVIFHAGNKPFGCGFSISLLNSISEHLFMHEKNLTLLAGERLQSLNSDELFCYCTANSLAGLLVMNLPADSAFNQVLLHSKLPFILLANASSIPDCCNYVTSSNYGSTKEMLEYMICLGHHRIAFLGVICNQMESHMERVRAYRDVHQAHSLPVCSEYLLDLPDASINTVSNSLQKLLAPPEKPTALFLAGENLEKVYQLLPGLGYRVPADLSVAGFMNEKEDSVQQYHYSAICQNTAEIGRRGVLHLLNLLDNPREKVSEVIDCKITFGKTVRRIEKGAQTGAQLPQQTALNHQPAQLVG